MNGYYTDREQTTRCTPVSRPAASRLDRLYEAMYAIIAAILRVLCDRTVRRVIRYALVAICAVCFIGLIGGMEQGMITLGGGIFAGLVLIFVEILCLR